MKQRLESLIRKDIFSIHCKKDRELEIMAGSGRNYEVFKNYFLNVEMVEQSTYMITLYSLYISIFAHFGQLIRIN